MLGFMEVFYNNSAVLQQLIFIVCLPYIECQREKEKKSVHQQILKGDLTIK